MPVAPTKTLVRDRLKPFRYPERAKTIAVRLPGGVNYPAGQVLAEDQRTAADEVQTITLGGTPNGGSFTLLYPSSSAGGYDSTGAIAWNGTGATLAANIQAALDALFGTSQVVVTGAGPFTLTYSGSELSKRDVPLPIAINNLTGTTPTVTPAVTTEGSPGLVGTFAAYNDAGANGIDVARALLVEPVRTAVNGAVIDEFGNTNTLTTQAYISGEFLCSDLVGLDANAVADLGKLKSGSAFNVAGAVLEVL